MISTGIIEDIQEVRESVSSYLTLQENIYCEYSACSIEEFFEIIDPSSLPDVLILDIGLPGISGLTGIRLIKEKFPTIDIIMFTVYDDHNRIFEALCAGAVGYLLKNSPFDKIREAIEDVYKGGSHMSSQIARKVVENLSSKKPSKDFSLTDKEKLIAEALCEGASYRTISSNMGIAIDTVRFHIKNIYKKLHVNSKTEMASKYLKGKLFLFF